MCHESKVKHFSGAHNYSCFFLASLAHLAHFFNARETTQDVINLKDPSTVFLSKSHILESESIRVMKVIQYRNQNTQADIQRTREQIH